MIFLGRITKQENTLMGGCNLVPKHLWTEKRLGNEERKFWCKYGNPKCDSTPSRGPKKGSSKHQYYDFRNPIFPSSHKSVASGICGLNS